MFFLSRVWYNSYSSRNWALAKYCSYSRLVHRWSHLNCCIHFHFMARISRILFVRYSGKYFGTWWFGYKQFHINFTSLRAMYHAQLLEKLRIIKNAHVLFLKDASLKRNLSDICEILKIKRGYTKHQSLRMLLNQ